MDVFHVLTFLNKKVLTQLHRGKPLACPFFSSCHLLTPSSGEEDIIQHCNVWMARTLYAASYVFIYFLHLNDFHGLLVTCKLQSNSFILFVAKKWPTLPVSVNTNTPKPVHFKWLIACVWNDCFIIHSVLQEDRTVLLLTCVCLNVCTCLLQKVLAVNLNNDMIKSSAKPSLSKCLCCFYRRVFEIAEPSFFTICRNLRNNFKKNIVSILIFKNSVRSTVDLNFFAISFNAFFLCWIHIHLISVLDILIDICKTCVIHSQFCNKTPTKFCLMYVSMGDQKKNNVMCIISQSLN